MWGLIYRNILSCRNSIIIIFSLNLISALIFLLTVALVPGSMDSEIPAVIKTFEVLAVTLMWIDTPSMLIAADEKKVYSGWLISSPKKISEIVMSKYAASLLAVIFAVNFEYIVTNIYDMIIFRRFNENPDTMMFSMTILLFSVLVLVWAVEIPFMIRFSAVKGAGMKLAVFTGLSLLFVVINLYCDMEQSMDAVFSFFLSEEKSNLYWFLTGLFPVISVLLYYLSFRISCILYRKGAENHG